MKAPLGFALGLRRADGKVFEVEREKLSAADQAFLAETTTRKDAEVSVAEWVSQGGIFLILP